MPTLTSLFLASCLLTLIYVYYLRVYLLGASLIPTLVCWCGKDDPYPVFCHKGKGGGFLPLCAVTLRLQIA